MNLIICASPLQVLIAERIIASKPNERFYGLMYSRSVSDKDKHYYQRLRSFCHDAEHLIALPNRTPRWLMWFDTLQMIYKGKSLGAIEAVYIASPEIDMQLILSTHPKAEVYTYDDGLINLVPSAWEAIFNTCDGPFNRLVRKIFGTPTESDIIQRSKRHYTIYRLPNVMPRTEYLPLFQPIQEEDRPTEHTVRILLGQMLYWDEWKERNAQLAKEVLRQYDIHYYMPHPKEGYRVDGVEYLHSPLVFEDFIMQALRDNPTTHYEVYLYCSTPSLNLHGVHPRLSFVSIKPADSPAIFDYTYQLIQEAGIPVLPHTLAQ